MSDLFHHNHLLNHSLANLAQSAWNQTNNMMRRNIGIFLASSDISLSDTQIKDVDEAAYRQGEPTVTWQAEVSTRTGLPHVD